MHILVTGGSGTVGRHVVKELVTHGHTVRTVDRLANAQVGKLDGVESVYADIADPFAMMTHMAGCDAVAHIAAYPHPHGFLSSELLRVNVIGTQNVLDAAAAHGIERVIITSSVGALGFSFPVSTCHPDYLPVDAAHPRRPQDLYGLTKVMNEESAAAMTRRTGMTTIVLRPPWVADIARSLREGWLHRMLAMKEQKYDTSLWAYIDAADLARAYRLALESSLTGHHIFYPMADDLLTKKSLPALVEQYLPQLTQYVDRLPGNSFYDLQTIREQLGFTAERRWEQILAEVEKE